MADEKESSESISFARLSDDIVIVRVMGKGSYENSPMLRKVVDTCYQKSDKVCFVLDLERCSSMDSTFMGTLAGITLRQQRMGGGKTVVLNVSKENAHLFDTLGLKYILDIRTPRPEEQAQNHLLKAPQGISMSKLERTIHMMEAHEQLVDLDTSNEIRFEGVMKYLRESLKSQKDNPAR